VVISSEAGGTMIHEAVGHGLEADLVQKGLSKFAGQVGQQVASAVVTVVDDATMPQKRGSFAIDDEGTPAARTVLIEDGVLKGFLHDLMTAKKESTGPTGNGRRESFRHKPIPRMTNTMIVPGKSEPDDVVADTKHGLFVRKMGGGQVNTVNGDFMFEVSEGYLIHDGKVGPAVRGAALVGNGSEVLQKIDMVAADHGFAVGTCGKDGQGVPVSDAQPTLRISELTVGGTAG
jgi:TldD protein